MGNRFIWPFVTGYIYSSSWVITHYSSARVAMMTHPSMVGGRVYRNRTHFLSISDALGWRHCDHGHFEQPAMQVCMVNVCSRIGWSHLVFIWYIYMCFSWWCSTSSIYAIQLLTFGIPWNSFWNPIGAAFLLWTPGADHRERWDYGSNLCHSTFIGALMIWNMFTLW